MLYLLRTGGILRMGLSLESAVSIYQVSFYFASFAQRNPKLLFLTSGVKKLLLKVGALNPQPYERQSNQEPPFNTLLSLPYSARVTGLSGCGR